MTQPAYLLLDACCLLNLYATGRLRDIALAQPHRLVATDYVVEQETLYVSRPGLGDAREERVPVDLSRIVEEGVIHVLHLDHQEEEAIFVDLASLLDDGEAITCALALHRGFGVATDDRKARRVLGNLAPTVPLVSTLELLRQWAEKSSVAPADLRAVFRAMQSGASYMPAESDPLFEWWSGVVQDDRSV